MLVNIWDYLDCARNPSVDRQQSEAEPNHKIGCMVGEDFEKLCSSPKDNSLTQLHAIPRT